MREETLTTSEVNPIRTQLVIRTSITETVIFLGDFTLGEVPASTLLGSQCIGVTYIAVDN